MNKITTTVQVAIPENFLIYDLADETLYCHGCGKSEAHPTVSLLPAVCLCGRKECPSAGTAHTSSASFKDFIQRHSPCVVAHVAKKERKKAIREEARQPCRQDYRNANGSGPHECGKVDGHSGSCGPSS